jgi:hypothetical protein
MTPAQVTSKMRKWQTLQDKQAVLEQKADALLEQIQEVCPHPVESLLEAPYQSYCESVSPPFRVCRLCGYAEEGWGCGYQKLGPNNYDVPTLNRDRVFELVKGRVHT